MTERKRFLPFVRLAIFGLSLFLIVARAGEEYELVRASVRFICINCLGLSG
jgi:hypothetical protein